jgi:hypothetical protein
VLIRLRTLGLDLVLESRVPFLVALVALAIIVIAPAASPAAWAQSIAGVSFVQVFEPAKDAEASQCNEMANGLIKTKAGDWTPYIKIKTDSRTGGCLHRFSIIDTGGRLPDLHISVSYWGDGDATQCGNPGTHDIPRLTRDPVRETAADWSPPLKLDTDQRRGGCHQRWAMRGRTDVALDIDFVPDGEAEQCGNAGPFTVTGETMAQFRIKTTDQNGGCLLRFRLRSIVGTRR